MLYNAALLFCVFAWAWLQPAGSKANTESETAGMMRQVQHHIESRLSVQNQTQQFVCRGETICGFKLIPLFYRELGFAPAWMNGRKLRPKAKVLIQAVQNAFHDGLEPQDYHAIAIAETLAMLTNASDFTIQKQAEYWADLDLLLTDAFLLLGTHLSGGRIDPETLHSDWLVGERSIDLLLLLHTASDVNRLDHAIEQLRPAHRGYLGLRNAMRRLRIQQAQGGWPAITGGATLRPGNSDPRVPTLRRRLGLSGDIESGHASDAPTHYDDALVNAVKRFQTRHGLTPDGAVGPKTRKAMNVSIDKRIRQIELNLERWRWLPNDLGHRRIVVNTADFSLRVVEGDADVLKMRVVVGRPARRTPVFSSQMSYMVFNPYWNVPHTIAAEDILPKLVSDVDYLARQNIRVFTDWTESAGEINPQTVNWTRYDETYFPFRLRQEPGPNNALGRIKFIFPNRFAVYLHDTPQRSLFNFTQRDFSSGCIRLENAQALAAYLLNGQPAGLPETLASTLNRGMRRVVRIPNPIPVHLIYMTAWVDHDNRLQFRNDIYHRDRDLNTALKQRPPDPPPPLATMDESGAADEF
ncbi:MAG: L,D-transpeptidase family protein [Desulfobacteraceae bacterium]|jgi:murein L,D-transpeptidase YcbB/YkuD